MKDKQVSLREVVKFIRDEKRSTVDKRNRNAIANAVRRKFK